MDRKEAVLRIKNHMEHHGIGKYPHLKLKEALDMAIAALSQPNEPMTLEQLREMDGEPVWIVEHPDWGHWELSADAEDYIADRDQDLYGLKHDDPAGQCGLHVLGWLAYRRPPEGGEINKITVVQYLGRLEDVALRPVSREQVEKVFPGCEKCRNQANWPSWIEKGFVYCPKCGTPLTSWAWEKQVERLEALKDGDLE